MHSLLLRTQAESKLGSSEMDLASLAASAAGALVPSLALNASLGEPSHAAIPTALQPSHHTDMLRLMETGVRLGMADSAVEACATCQCMAMVNELTPAQQVRTGEMHWAHGRRVGSTHEAATRCDPDDPRPLAAVHGASAYSPSPAPPSHPTRRSASLATAGPSSRCSATTAATRWATECALRRRRRRRL